MGFFKIRRALAVSGGSVLIGADTNIYRDAADRLKTDDALEIAGTAKITGAAALGIASFSGSVTLSGTPFVVPYTATAPGLTQNGEVKTYASTNVGKLSLRAGGTIYTISLPSATHGTITVTVGDPPS